MSHWSKINLKVTDMQALRTAVAELNGDAEVGGCSLQENAVCRSYRSETLPLVLHLDNSIYDVGFAIAEDGNGYEVTYDKYRGHVEKLLGQNCRKLRVSYGMALATQKARARGMNVTRSGERLIIREAVTV